MKNLISYFVDNSAYQPGVEEYLRLQIDNSLRMGWVAADLLICTNFEFAHRNVRSRVIECRDKGTFGKWYGLREAVRTEQPVWSHDHDGWQILPLPTVTNGRPFKLHIWQWATIAGSPLVPLYTTGSMFVLPSALPFIEAIIDYENRHPISQFKNLDEVLLSKFLIDNPKWMSHIDPGLGLEYCFSTGKDESRLSELNLPLRYVHCKFGEAIQCQIGGMRLCYPRDFRELLGEKAKFEN